LLAVHAGHADVVRALLAAGARTSVRDTATEDTPLHVAAGQKDLEIVRLLLQHGAEARCRNLEGQRAVDVALLRGHREIELLLRQRMRLAVPGRDAIQVSHILLKHSASEA
jgi:ankyrin repeat protein